MTAPSRLRAMLVDPSLFTAPYDAALNQGLIAAGVEPCWAIRPTRRGDRDEIEAQYTDKFFYRWVDGATRLPPRLRSVAKGFAHALGLLRLLARVRAQRPAVVHFQWAVVPLLDTLAMLLLRRWCSVVLTVHDTTPLNGERTSRWQTLAFDLPIKCAGRVVVHTQSARAALVQRGVAESKLAVIPHGPLELHSQPAAAAERVDGRWTFVLFGELKRYKGLDVLVEALALLPAAVRSQARVIIAGRPRMDLAAVLDRITRQGLDSMLEIRAQRLSEQEMADLFACADCFLFPYRQVDASGVYFLVKSSAKWVIASRVGVFAEDVREGVQGALVPPEDARALSAAIAHAIQERPRPAATSPSTAWASIGSATRDLYLQSLTERQPQQSVASAAASEAPGAPLQAKQVPRRALVIAAAAAAALAMATWLSRSVFAARAGAPPPVAPAAEAEVKQGEAPRGLGTGSGYRLVKNWDFRTQIRDAQALRAEFHTRYVYGNGTLDHLNDEWSRYRDDDNHVFTPEGLALVARAHGELAPGSVESGMLRSRWSGQYGVFEIRAQVPAGRGLWPAFWLNPEDQIWPPEIDVMEIVDNGRDTTRRSFHFLHGAGADKAPQRISKLNRYHAFEPGIDYARGYHVFSVEWEPARVCHRVDGEVVVDREFHWRHDDGKDAGPAHVLVNLAVGGKWPGPPSAHSLPAQLRIEYIRVWQR